MKQTKTYLPKSWSHPALLARPSAVHGQGIFTTAPFTAGTVVMEWGGTVLQRAQLATVQNRHAIVAIGEGLYLGENADGSDSLDSWLNHCCDPNVWLADEVTVTARRDIAAGEEILIDQALYLTPDTAWAFDCHCGAALCRGRVTAFDWRRLDLQDRYGEHFSPFIVARIRALSG